MFETINKPVDEPVKEDKRSPRLDPWHPFMDRIHVGSHFTRYLLGANKKYILRTWRENHPLWCMGMSIKE